MNNGKTWNWRIEEMSPRVEFFAGHCRAKGCQALGQVFVVYSYPSGRDGAVRDARKIMCRADAEAAVAKHSSAVRP